MGGEGEGCERGCGCVKVRDVRWGCGVCEG